MAAALLLSCCIASIGAASAATAAHVPSVDLICLISLICLSSPSGFGLAARILTGTFAGHTITRVPLVVAHDGLCGVNGGTNSPSVTLGVDIVTH